MLQLTILSLIIGRTTGWPRRQYTVQKYNRTHIHMY